MSDKATLLREDTEAFTELRQAAEGLRDEQMQQVWLGTWGVREILIHISGWHRAMATALRHVAQGQPPFPEGTYDDFDAWNARFVEEKTGVKAADVLVELEAAHRDFVDAASALPDAHFVTGAGARGLFDGAGPGHYREHSAQIKEWRRAAVR